MALGDTANVPRTVTATVVERLREEIRNGSVKPGQRLRQAHLADLYGVSTTPVREAFVALEREGLLQSTAHRGVVVFEPTAANLREIYEIRIPLEALATRKAVPNLTSVDLEAMTAILDELAGGVGEGQISRAGDLNDEFHSRIYAAANRPQLLGLITEFRASSRAYMRIFTVLARDARESDAEHREIYELCVSGDAERAERAMIAHLQHTVDTVSSELERTGR